MRSDEFCFHLRTCYSNCLVWIIEGCFLCTDDFVGSMKWCYKWPLCTIDDTSVWIFSILGPPGQIQEPGDIPVFKPMKPNTSLAISSKTKEPNNGKKHTLIVFSIPNIILEFSHLGHTQPIIIIYHIYHIYEYHNYIPTQVPIDHWDQLPAGVRHLNCRFNWLLCSVELLRKSLVSSKAFRTERLFLEQCWGEDMFAKNLASSIWIYIRPSTKHHICMIMNDLCNNCSLIIEILVSFFPPQTGICQCSSSPPQPQPQREVSTMTEAANRVIETSASAGGNGSVGDFFDFSPYSLQTNHIYI